MYKMNKGSKSKLSSSRYSNTSVSQKSKNDSKRNIHEINNNQAVSSSQSKRARTSSHRKINQMSNKIFINKHLQIDNINKSIENAEKQSNKNFHLRQASYNPPNNADVMFNQVNLQYHQKLVDPLKIKYRDSCNRSMSNSKLKKKKGKFSNISISKIKLPNQTNISDSSFQNTSISSSANTKSRKANIEMKMKINQMIDQTCNFNKKVLSIDGYSAKSPHIVIPQGKIQIKQQYLNSSFIGSKDKSKSKNS